MLFLSAKKFHLGFVGAISTIVIIVLCIYTKRKRQAQLVKGVEADSLVHPFQLPSSFQTIPQLNDANKHLPHHYASPICTLNNYGIRPQSII